MQNSQFHFRWWALVGLSILSFTAFLDLNMVTTAIPFIQKTFHVSISELQWLPNIFAMALCMFLIIMGRFADIFGHRKFLYIGFALFAVSSFCAGASPNIHWLIFFRGLQGLASATIFTSGTALLAEIFSKKEQISAIGIFSAFNGAGLVLGTFFSGLLITYLSWRWEI